MKIIFAKATTEATYLEVYVKLCILLFKKFNHREKESRSSAEGNRESVNDKKNIEMNFKKLLLIKC